MQARVTRPTKTRAVPEESADGEAPDVGVEDAASAPPDAGEIELTFVADEDEDGADD